MRCKCRVYTGLKWCFQHKEQITFIDLFSGGGGFSQGFIRAGLKPLLCLDRDIFACNTLKKNHPNVPVVHSSVETYNFSPFKNRVDILLAGAPCQSFSFAGLKKGLHDHNGSALLSSIEVIFSVQPKIFIIENVKGLLTHAGGATFKYILGLLSKNNLYSVEYKLINMVDYGIPQKRERVLIVGFLKKKNFFPIPILFQKQLLGDALKSVAVSKGAQYSVTKQSLFKLIPQGGCWINLPLELQKAYLGNSFLSKGGKRGILRRLSMTEPALTLLCSPSQKQTERCHPIENRPLSISEYARIQTFPDNYTFCGSVFSQYQQIGNAVPCLFAYQLGVHLLGFF